MSNPIVIDYEDVSYSKEVKSFGKKIPPYMKNYFLNLVPFIYWFHRYNLTWLVSDIIAGVTVGIVAVPQGMGYAKIANLAPQYGLYSSFVGLCLYCFFGTSKDISIGPTAVMSLLVGQTVAKVTMSSEYTAPQVAVILALFGGFITLLMGFIRLGILIDFIPAPAIAGFMTGSSITISVGQWPKLFGISTVNTHDSAYLIFGNFFKHLPDTKLDAVFGIIGLIWLYSVRWGTGYLTDRYPKYKKIFFFINIMRNGVLVIFGTLIAFLINIGRDTSPISILKSVPSGFTAMGVPNIDINLLSQVSSTLPSVTIILLLEHVAIAKSFGRINNYKIDADQEIIAIGAANVIGSFFGAYPNTGSFSRTAINARSGARTPLSGVFSALVVLLCLYVLTPAFYYIPDAILSAVIIHAVADLVVKPSYLKQLYKVSPFELFTVIAGVVITFFSSVEYGIYVSVGLSIAVMLIRIARPRYAVLGRIPIYPGKNDNQSTRPVYNTEECTAINSTKSDNSTSTEYVYIKRDHQTLSHLVESPPPGVVIFRFDEALTYPNAGYTSDKILQYIQDNYTSGSPPPKTKGERAWNDRRPVGGDPEPHDGSSALYSIVIDCSAMNHLDATGAQTLVDLRTTITRYIGHEVKWHFASISSPIIRNALISSGFDKQTDTGLAPPPMKKANDSVSDLSDSDDNKYVAKKSNCDHVEDVTFAEKNISADTIEDEDNPSYTITVDTVERGVPIDRYPYFHWDLENAVRAATYTQRNLF
ncbi:sulfate permease [Backusella circina FSU 941]|nr:sulfate permease [Backusella circina FSU 941]